MSDSEAFIQGLLMDAIRKIDAVSEKVDDKIDSLEEKLTSNHKEFKDAINLRLDPLENQVRENSTKITTHEHYFKLLTFCITGGLASIAGAWSWLSQLFTHK